MKVDDYTAKAFSLEEVMADAEEALKRRDKKGALTVLINLVKRVPDSVPGSVYLAIGKGEATQLPRTEQLLANMLILRDELRLFIDGGDLIVPRGRPKLRGPNSTEIRRHIANARKGIHGGSFRQSWIAVWGANSSDKGPPKKEDGELYTPKESAEIVIWQVEAKHAPAEVKLRQAKNLSISDLESLL